MKPVYRRALFLLVPTSAGIGLGMSAEWPFSFDDFASGLLLSPFVIPIGGRWVSESFAFWFGLGGLLFWPGYFLLASLWVVRSTWWAPLVVVPWCAQAFFHVLLRLAGVMSV